MNIYRNGDHGNKRSSSSFGTKIRRLRAAIKVSIVSVSALCVVSPPCRRMESRDVRETLTPASIAEQPSSRGAGKSLCPYNSTNSFKGSVGYLMGHAEGMNHPHTALILILCYCFDGTWPHKMPAQAQNQRLTETQYQCLNVTV